MNLRTFFYSLLGLFGIFLVLFSWSTYRYYEIVHADDPVSPMLHADAGTSKIIRKDLTYELSESEEYKIESNDVIETSLESKATITWPDKSITRLGPKTRIVIEKMYASTNYDDIEIAYSMERGKIWNTVIRSLVGESYFEVHLPRESIVAGVRGTIFEINLENRYIRAINHTTLLSQKSQSIELLPGELVDSENIMLKKGKEWLDATWNEWNAKADTLYESVRSLEIETRMSDLTKDIGKVSLSNLTRSILEKMPGFEDITIAEYLKTDRIAELKDVSTDALLSYYQKLGNFGNSTLKESLRSTLLSVDNSTIAKIRDSLEMHAFLDSIDTGIISESTRVYLEKKGVNIDAFKTRFTEGAKNDLNNFSDILSGSLSTIIGQ